MMRPFVSSIHAYTSSGPRVRRRWRVSTLSAGRSVKCWSERRTPGHGARVRAGGAGGGGARSDGAEEQVGRGGRRLLRDWHAARGALAATVVAAVDGRVAQARCAMASGGRPPAGGAGTPPQGGDGAAAGDATASPMSPVDLENALSVARADTAKGRSKLTSAIRKGKSIEKERDELRTQLASAREALEDTEARLATAEAEVTAGGPSITAAALEDLREQVAALQASREAASAALATETAARASSEEARSQDGQAQSSRA